MLLILERNKKMCTHTIHNFNNNIAWVCKHYPDFRHLKDIVKKETNIIVLVVDILRHSSGLNGRREALFDYHIGT